MKNKKLILFFIALLVSVILIVLYDFFLNTSPIERLNKLYHLNLSKTNKVLLWDERWGVNGDGHTKGLIELSNSDCRNLIDLQKDAYNIKTLQNDLKEIESIKIKNAYLLKDVNTKTEQMNLILLKTKKACYLYYNLSII